MRAKKRSKVYRWCSVLLVCKNIMEFVNNNWCTVESFDAVWLLNSPHYFVHCNSILFCDWVCGFRSALNIILTSFVSHPSFGMGLTRMWVAIGVKYCNMCICIHHSYCEFNFIPRAYLERSPKRHSVSDSLANCVTQLVCLTCMSSINFVSDSYNKLKQPVFGNLVPSGLVCLLEPWSRRVAWKGGRPLIGVFLNRNSLVMRGLSQQDLQIAAF